MAKSADKVAPAGAVQALSDFGYGGNVGRVYRGEVFVPEGHVNDEVMARLRYWTPVAEGTHLFECGDCGKLYISEITREEHGIAAHEMRCVCGWLPAPSDRLTMDEHLARHKMRCDEWRAGRDAHFQRRAQEVKDIKAGQPVPVG